jgi:hypothetical protein
MNRMGCNVWNVGIGHIHWTLRSMVMRNCGIELVCVVPEFHPVSHGNVLRHIHTQFSMCFDTTGAVHLVADLILGITHSPLCFDSSIIKDKALALRHTHPSLPPTRCKVSLPQGVRSPSTRSPSARSPSHKAQGLPPLGLGPLQGLPPLGLPPQGVRSPSCKGQGLPLLPARRKVQNSKTLPGGDLGIRSESLVRPSTIFSHL